MLLEGEGLSEAVAHPWMDVRWVAQANGTIGPNASVVKWQEQPHAQVCVEDVHRILVGRRPSDIPLMLQEGVGGAPVLTEGGNQVSIISTIVVLVIAELGEVLQVQEPCLQPYSQG